MRGKKYLHTKETTVIYLRAGKKVPWNSNDPEVKKMLLGLRLDTKSLEKNLQKKFSQKIFKKNLEGYIYVLAAN